MTPHDDIKEAVSFLADTLELTLTLARNAGNPEEEGALDDIEEALEAYKQGLREAGLLPLPLDPEITSVDDAVAQLSSTSSEAPRGEVPQG
jgi:hypothetical protein